MRAFETKAFKSGNGVAVRLPKELGFEAGDELLIECSPEGAVIKRKKRSAAELVRRLRELPKPDYVQEREPIEFPRRRGL